jgi:hypothetical protein
MNELRMNGRAARKALMASGLAAGLLAFFTTGVSAAIACRGDVCWRVHEGYVYPRSPTIVIHPDYWEPPSPRIVIHPEGWGPVERFTREYVVPDYYGYVGPNW